MREPRAGQQWRHYKGGLYDVLHRGRWEPTGEEVVVYQAPNGTVWVRLLAVWMEEVQPGVPRFTLVAHAPRALSTEPREPEAP